MTKIAAYICIIFKRTLKNPVIYILCLLVPACMILSSFIEKDSVPTTVGVGIYFETDDDTSSTLANLLINKTGAFEFISYDSPDLLINDVRTGSLECGYVFPKTFTQALKSGRVKNSVLLYVSPSTIFHSVVNEIIFSDIMKLGGYAVMDSELELSGGQLSEDETARDYMYERYKYYCDSSDIFHVNIETIDHKVLNNSDDGIHVPFPKRGLISVIIFLAAMTGSICFIEDRDKGIFDVHTKNFLMWSRILYILIPVLFFTVLSEAVLFVTANANSFTKESLISFRYTIILVIFSNLCITLLHRKEIIIALIPVICLASLIFCPIFVNLAASVPIFSIIQKFLVPYYFL